MPTHGNAVETASVEPSFLIVKRLPSNASQTEKNEKQRENDKKLEKNEETDPLDAQPNVVLERVSFTVAEVMQFTWIASGPAPKTQTLSAASAGGVKQQSATSTLISVPVLTTPHDINAGVEFMLRDMSWIKEDVKKARKGPVMISSPKKRLKEV